MTTLPTTSSSEASASLPTRGTQAYFCARNRTQIYNLIVREFKKSGLSQKELAHRARMSPERISRIFKRPQNLELNTISKLIHGMTGAAIEVLLAYPQTTQTRLVAYIEIVPTTETLPNIVRWAGTSTSLTSVGSTVARGFTVLDTIEGEPVNLEKGTNKFGSWTGPFESQETTVVPVHGNRLEIANAGD